MLSAATPTFNNKEGNGKYKPLRKRKKQTEDSQGIEQDFYYLSTTDRRMRFNNAKDPIYVVFDSLDNRPIQQLMKEFVKDSLFEISNFVSRVIK